MYIKTNQNYEIFEDDSLSKFLSKVTFQINSYGIWKSDKDTHASYVTNDIELVYYIKGGSTTYVGNEKYVCPPRSLLILDSYNLNTSYNEGYNEYAYYYFHFDIEPYYLKDQFISILTKNGRLIYPEEFNDYHIMLDRLLIETTNKELGYSSVITSALIRMIVSIIRAQYKRNGSNYVELVDSPYIQLVNEAIIYIQKHLNEPIKIKELSKDIGVSNSKLYKAFISTIGISPVNYIQHQKIRQAQKLISLGKNLTEISLELGYSSSYHLSTSFKKIAGISPREYKKKMNKPLS